MTSVAISSDQHTAIIADDHALLRDGIRKMLTSQAGISVVAEAEDGLQAIALVRQHRPSLLSLDLAMPYAQGLAIYGEVRRWSPETRIIVFTGLTSVGILSELVAAGVDGLFLKRGDPEHMIRAIPLILNSGKVVAPEIIELLENKPLVHVLTDRERQIISLIASGFTNKEIAAQLGVSIKTIDNHRTNLMRKLDVNSAAELLSYALREGLLDASAQL